MKDTNTVINRKTPRPTFLIVCLAYTACLSSCGINTDDTYLNKYCQEND